MNGTNLGSTMYATKRRRRNSKSVRVPPKDGGQVPTKSNPSKRHRERLNAELDTLANLLPYEQNVLSKLDKLSILRLSVSYLRTKSYFQAVFHREMEQRGPDHKSRDLLYPELLMEGDMILQALNGFLLILTCDGEVFYASHTVETYLGFHQSDICHQSVYELVHSEDREELQRHLLWNGHLPPDRSSVTLQEALLTEHAQYLERNFTVRFRCLLDNTSGFLRLDIRGRIKVLHGQNHKTEDPPLALFAVCTPFGPPSLLEMPQKESMFKSKHKLDLSLVTIDQRGKQILGYSDSEMTTQGGYDLVHYDDLAYVASAHQELLKTGASGLIAYRLQTKDGDWQWLQTSARLVYKNSKPDFILCTHRPLMEEEGRDLLGKRTMDFKVTYLDGGLGAITERSGLLNDNELILRCQRNRRYKSQIKDILQTCRKRKASSSSEPYVEEPQYNNVYATTYPATAAEAVNGLTPYPASMSQNLFLDNSRFLAQENFLHYHRAYYPDYSQYTSNGLLDPTRSCFPAGYPAPSPDPSATTKDEKLYPCQLETKFNGDSRLVQTLKPSCCENYPAPADPAAAAALRLGVHPFLDRTELPKMPEFNCRTFPAVTVEPSKPASPPPLDTKPPPEYTSNDTRQSVLMWGTSPYEAAAKLGTKFAAAKSEVCRWAAAPKSVSPQNSSSPASGKVAPLPASAMPYPPDLGLEVGSPPDCSMPPLRTFLAQDWNPPKLLTTSWRHHLPTASSSKNDLLLRRHHGDGNPLLSISEVTNTLLDHD